MNVMVKRKLSPEWKTWLRTNLAAGCGKDGLFKILLDNGFDYQTVKREMKYEPSQPIYMLRNPLKDPHRNESAKSAQACETLDWSEIFIANANVIKHGSYQLQQLDGFLMEEEFGRLTTLLKNAVSGTHKTAATSFRIPALSKMPGKTDLLKGLTKRIDRLMGIHPSYADELGALVIGEAGVEYPLTVDPKRELDFTLVICLDNSAAAELAMVDAASKVVVQAGALYVWQYTDNSSSRSLAGALSNTSGDGGSVFLYKNFYRDSTETPAPNRYTKEANEYIRNYTETGFIKTRIPDDLFKKITDFYHQNRKLQDKETVEGGYVYNQTDKKRQSSTLVHLSESLKKEIHDTVLPEVAAWCGKELEPSYVYGIRVYKDKAILKPHRDRIETHVLGVIINVDQEVREDWPLMIDDHSYREHKILLQPGDMVFYESARLQHGRPIAFNGESFANIFCHLRPVDYVLRR